MDRVAVSTDLLPDEIGQFLARGVGREPDEQRREQQE
jgi:hypothetical protein